MSFQLDKGSLNKLRGVHPKLIELVTFVARFSAYPFKVISGVRSAKLQYRYYLLGQSGQGYPTPCDGTKKRSSHQTCLDDGYGYAIDIAIVGGDPARTKITEISYMFKAQARNMGIVIRWGGDFKKRDFGHFDLRGNTFKLVGGEETVQTKEIPKKEEVSPDTVDKEKAKDIQYQFYTITRDNSLIQNGTCIGDSEAPIIPFNSEFTLENFLDTKLDHPDEDGSTPTNWERIQRTYILNEKDKYTKLSPFIKSGTKVVLPLLFQIKNNINESLINKDPETVGIVDFYDQKGKELINDPYYDERLNREEDYIYYKNKTFDTLPFITSETITVWVYSNIENKVFNLSNKVSRMSISKFMKGSSFDFSLENISFEGEIFNDSVDSISIQNFKGTTGEGFAILPDLITSFSNNDIVFLKFGEVDRNLKDYVEIPLHEISGKVYDLIGLLDSPQEEVNYQDNNITIHFSGRDFIKVLEEDEAKFFPVALTEGLNGRIVLGSSGTGEKLLHRLFLGDYVTLFSKVENPVGKVFQWYLSLLSNMGVLGEEGEKSLFTSYGDRRQYRDTEKKTLQSGIYQIIKLIVDDSILNRKLVDANVGSPDGSFVQLFNNLCLPPFVEWYTDTFGDMFNIIVRQPPFTKKLITKYLDSSRVLTNRVVRNQFLEQTTLDFSDEIYTWYQLFPKGHNWAVTNQMALDYLPVIQLDEYINKWGSKCLSMTSNYLELDTSKDIGTSTRDEDFHKRSIDDLLLILETNCYLPFTRKGKIVLSIIDRSFRKGNFCYLEKTGEIFYIDSVTHSASISNKSLEGSTTLQVSRGMVEPFIEGETRGSKKYSYFNIVDLDLVKSILYDNYNLKSATIPGRKTNKFVDKEVFDFFYNKEQFSDFGKEDKFLIV